jgi:hypothetical protein
MWRRRVLPLLEGFLAMKSFLINGSLMTTLERRNATLKQMGKILAESGEGLVTDRDAVRVLLTNGFSAVDVAILAVEARMLAYQEIVAREMSQP